MRRTPILITVQGLLCLLQVYLVSKISLIGKVGIALFYKEYRIFRSGWKTFLLFFGLQLLVIVLLQIMEKRGPAKRTIFTATVIGIIAIVGLLFTFIDFQYTYSHRLLKERFHLGFYLFWLCMMGTCVVYIISNWQKRVITESKPGLPDAGQ